MNTNNYFRDRRDYWQRTRDRLQEAFAALDPPAEFQCVIHPSSTMAGEGWDLLTIDGVSLPAQLGDGAVYLWEPDPEVFDSTHEAQMFRMRRGRREAAACARALRHAVVDHEAIVASSRARRSEERKRAEAERLERDRKWAEAVAYAAARRVAFEASVSLRNLYGAGSVHLCVSEPVQDCGGRVYSHGGSATITVKFDPPTPEKAREVIDALVSAGLLQRRTAAGGSR